MSRVASGLALAAVVLLVATALPAEDDAGASGEPIRRPGADDSVETGASKNVTDALQGKDGVRIQTMCTHCNSANVQVGGLNQDLVPISRDGWPILGGLATSFVFQMLPADAVAEAKVLKGPGAAREPGPAAGGVIRLTEARPAELPRIDLDVEAGSFDRRAGTVRAAGRLAQGLSAALTAGKETASPVDADGDGWNDVGAVDREFTEGRIDAELGDHELDAAVSWISEDGEDGRGAFDVLSYISNPTDPTPGWTREDTLVDRREYRTGWTWRRAGGETLSVRLLEADRHQKVRSQLTRLPDYRGTDSDALFDRFRIREIDRWGGARWVRPLGYTWKIEAGAERHEQTVEAETVELFGLLLGAAPEPQRGTDFLDVDSGYASLAWAPRSTWSFEAGLRYDAARWGARELGRRRDDAATSPRATLAWRPVTGLTLKLIGGRTFRAPRPILSEVCCGQSYQRSYEARAETGTTFAVEGVWQPGPRVRASAYAGRTDFDDHILRMVAWSQLYTQTYALANVPRARAETLEFALRWSPMTALSLDASAGWLSFRNVGDPVVDVRVAPPSTATPVVVSLPIDRIPYQPVRTGSLSATVRLGDGWVLGGRAGYTGPMRIQQFDSDPFAGQNILLDAMRETPGFWLVNLSAEVPLPRDVRLVAGIDNVTDRVQNDLGDPTTDYNWGPLTGRAFRIGLRWAPRR